jgi:hypothetical protein
MTPIRPPSPLQALAYLTKGQIICRKDFAPDGPLLFRAGQSYRMVVMYVRSSWYEMRQTATGSTQRVDYAGYETGFKIADDSGTDRWFRELRLGRHVTMKPITAHDFTLHELIEHFEIPKVESLSEARTSEYQQAIEKLKCLTKQTPE